MESYEQMDVDEPSTSDKSSMFNHNSVPVRNNVQHFPCNGFANPTPSTSKNETLADILADVPDEILSGCGPEEAFRPDYKAAIFPRTRPPDAPIIEPTMSAFHEEEILDPDDCYYFESDHLALKNNDDYRNVLKAVVILQAQRTKAIKDLDELLLAKKKALEDPIAYVARLQSGDLPEYPGPQKIAEIPVIDWTKYNVAQPDHNMRPKTRHAKTVPQQKIIEQKDDPDKQLVRGRVFDESKPKTFNKLWSSDEQRRLEELLIEYPPEEVEMRRWTKIANALGNRTPKQVSSRVQKYFLKLNKAGLPIPGREPKTTKTDRSRNRHRSNYTSFKKSTFFPYEHIVDEVRRAPIKEEPQEDPMSLSIKTEEFDCDVNQMEMLRKQVQEDKDDFAGESVYHHLGYKCFVCGQDPIKKTRWHCTICTEEINLCSDCALAQYQAEDPLHPPTHVLDKFQEPEYTKNFDADYLPDKFSKTFNYLDLNFLTG